MAAHRFTDAHAHALAEADGVFRLRVRIEAGRAGAEGLDLVGADGARGPFPGGQASTTDDPQVFEGTRAVVTGVTKSPPPDFMKVRSRSTPIVATRRVADGLDSLGVRSVIAVPADAEHANRTPLKKSRLEYTVVVPNAVQTEERVLGEPVSPFETRAIVRHAGAMPGLYAVPLNGAVGAEFFCDRTLVEHALVHDWTGVAFTHAGLPASFPLDEARAHRRADGSIAWRPPAPPERAPAEWIEYAVEHTDDAPGVLRHAAKLALIHHADAMLNAAAESLRIETDSRRRRVLAALIREGVRQHRAGRLENPPDQSVVNLASASGAGPG